MCVRIKNREREREEEEKKEKRLDGCVHMMSNACRRQHIGHSTMCTTTTRKRRKKKERTTANQASLGIYISSFTSLSLSLFSYPLVIDSVCLSNGISVVTSRKKKSFFKIKAPKKKKG